MSLVLDNPAELDTRVLSYLLDKQEGEDVSNMWTENWNICSVLLIVIQSKIKQSL